MTLSSYPAAREPFQSPNVDCRQAPAIFPNRRLSSPVADTAAVTMS